MLLWRTFIQCSASARFERRFIPFFERPVLSHGCLGTLSEPFPVLPRSMCLLILFFCVIQKLTPSANIHCPFQGRTLHTRASHPSAYTSASHKWTPSLPSSTSSSLALLSGAGISLLGSRLMAVASSTPSRMRAHPHNQRYLFFLLQRGKSRRHVQHQFLPLSRPCISHETFGLRFLLSH